MVPIGRTALRRYNILQCKVVYTYSSSHDDGRTNGRGVLLLVAVGIVLSLVVGLAGVHITSAPAEAQLAGISVTSGDLNDDGRIEVGLMYVKEGTATNLRISVTGPNHGYEWSDDGSFERVGEEEILQATNEVGDFTSVEEGTTVKVYGESGGREQLIVEYTYR